ncbi:MAG: YceI family protein [Kiritimatiellae bacterium]|nr:YceI family protein [Kiritimatiellia bacterium]
MPKLLIALLGAGVVASATFADSFKVDPMHTEIEFGVRHTGISTVKGTFNEFTGDFGYDPADLSTFRAEATIQVASVDTRVQPRDEDLRSANFFDAEKWPEITFKTTRAEENDGKVTLYGDLTIRDVTKEIALPITIYGPITDMSGETRVGFEGATKIDRRDYGITYAGTLAGGDLIIGNEITIHIICEGVKQVEEAGQADPTE